MELRASRQPQRVSGARILLVAVVLFVSLLCVFATVTDSWRCGPDETQGLCGNSD